MNLALDIGNSALKYGVFNNRTVLKVGTVRFPDIQEVTEVLLQENIKKVIVSTVTDIPDTLLNIIQELDAVIYLNETTPVPIRNGYETPHSLGNDRLANACAAAAIFPQTDVLILDAGTCLKFDFITQTGMYLGGAISPGLRMRYSALHHYTARLPLLEPVAAPKLIGSNTEGSIQSGVVLGMKGEIETIIRQYIELYPRLELIITGGDSDFFLNQLKSRIFAAPVLTLQGLNEILLFQTHDEIK